VNFNLQKIPFQYLQLTYDEQKNCPINWLASNADFSARWERLWFCTVDGTSRARTSEGCRSSETEAGQVSAVCCLFCWNESFFY